MTVRQNEARILTVGVPTHNRATNLEVFFERLDSSLITVNSHVEIHIADNASTDETCQMVTNWSRRTALKMHYTRHESNLGVSKNIIWLVENCKTEYFVLLGDDDELVSNGMARLVPFLLAKTPSSAVLDLANCSHQGDIFLGTFGDLAERFYEFGNAYAGIIHAPTAQRLLRQENTRSVLEKSSWPQTALGLTSAWVLRDKMSPAVSTLTWGRAQPESIRPREDFLYWQRSLSGLIIAANFIDHYTQSTSFVSSFIAVRSGGWIAHLRACFRCRVKGDPVSGSVLHLVSSLDQLSRIRRLFWSALLLSMKSRALSAFFLGVFTPIPEWRRICLVAIARLRSHGVVAGTTPYRSKPKAGYKNALEE